MAETEEKEICGNCQYHKYDFVKKEVVCGCEKSERHGSSLYYKDSCVEFSKKER